MTLNPFKTITMIEAVEGVIDMVEGFGMHSQWYPLNHGEGEQRYYLNHYYAKNDPNDYILSVDFKIKDGNKIPYRIAFVNDAGWNEAGDLVGLHEHGVIIKGNILSKHWKMKWDFKLWLMKQAIRKLYETQALMDKTEKIVAVKLAGKKFEN